MASSKRDWWKMPGSNQLVLTASFAMNFCSLHVNLAIAMNVRPQFTAKNASSTGLRAKRIVRNVRAATPGLFHALRVKPYQSYLAKLEFTVNIGQTGAMLSELFIILSSMKRMNVAHASTVRILLRKEKLRVSILLRIAQATLWTVISVVNLFLERNYCLTDATKCIRKLSTNSKRIELPT